MALTFDQIVSYAKSHWGKESELALLLDREKRKNSFRESREVKTVALFYRWFRNGGAQRVLSCLIDIFAGIGIKTVLFTDESPHEDDYVTTAEYVRIILPPCTSPLTFEKRAEIIRDAVRDYEIDLLIHHRHMDPGCFWDGLVCKSLGVSSILYTHGSFATYLQIGYIEDFLKLPLYYKPYDAIIALSRVDALYWSQHHNNVFVMPNPVQCINISERKEGVDSSNSFSNELLFAGRLSSENNYRDLLDIMDIVKDALPSAHLTICGKTTKPYDEDFESFRSDIVSRGLENFITIAGYQKDLAPYLENSAALIFLAEFGGWPLILLEAMSTGTPVISYDLPWLEISREKKGILKAMHGEKNDIAGKIVQLLNNGLLMSNLSREARELAESYQRLDDGKLWQGIFKAVSNYEQGTMAKPDGEDTGFWGKQYTVSQSTDPESNETLKLLIETYNLSLHLCQKHLSAGEDKERPYWLSNESNDRGALPAQENSC